MAFENFIPTVWAEGIERELERKCVYAEDCNRKYEGTVKQAGDTVRILGVAAPTIYDTNDKDIVLNGAETPADTSIVMPIRQIAYYNYKVGDIDEAQSKEKGIMDALAGETSAALASKMDAYIAKLAAEKEAVKYATAAVSLTADNVLGEIDKAVQRLYENDVNPNSKITLTLPPWMYTLFRQAYTGIDTNNSNYLKNGKITMYGGIQIKMSNNVYTANGVSHVMVRTDNAIAFANPLTHVEAYRPENGFADAVKGFVLYDAKIVRPKEMIIMNVKH